MAENGGGVLRRISASATVNPVGTRLATPRNLSSVPPFHQDRDRDIITLAQPRPGGARACNEYIETPLRPQLTNSHQHGPKGSVATTSTLKLEDGGSGHLSLLSRGRTSPATTSFLSAIPSVHQNNPHHHLVSHHLLQPSTGSASIGTATTRPFGSASVRNTHSLAPILSQPSVSTLKKKAADGSGSDVGSGGGGDDDGDGGSSGSEDSHPQSSSIMCNQCGRCKCEACRKPKQLPSTWLCGDKYQCSAETTVDYCSCMCCVKGLFYHCTKDYEIDSDVNCADKPCSCHPHQRCQRWGCLCVLTAILPCLLCYWPLKGCLKMCETCYRKCNSNGCQCPVENSFNKYSSDTSTASSNRRKDLTVDTLPKKRLLDSSIDC